MMADQRRFAKSRPPVGMYGVGLLPSQATRPVLIYLGNAEGAGKTLLAKCAISPTHGLVKTDGDLKDKAETAKELLSAVIETRPYILFDNCKRHLDSPYLEAFVSSAIWSGRILRPSKMFSDENLMIVFVTGNSCTVSQDMQRRSLFVELFMRDERAEDRKFQRILDDAVLLELRAQLLAALGAGAGTDKAGQRPNGPIALFRNGLNHRRNCRAWDMVARPECRNRCRRVDGSDMRELVKEFGFEDVKFDELVVLARKKGLFERIVGSDGDGDLKPAEKSAFGKLLKRYDRRLFSESKSFLVNGKGHSRTFGVVSTHGRHG